MKLSGLSRQWQTRDQLFAAFADHEETWSLLQCLENMDGPDLWVGSSHRFLRFLAQDSGLWPDEIPPLAYACALGDGERFQSRVELIAGSAASLPQGVPPAMIAPYFGQAWPAKKGRHARKLRQSCF